MDLNSLKKKQRMVVALPLFVCILGSYPLDAVAENSGIPVQEVLQNKAPLKRTLYGTVIDATSGESLVGVNIRVKGSDRGTITDLDGKFKLEVTNKTELECSYIGYERARR